MKYYKITIWNLTEKQAEEVHQKILNKLYSEDILLKKGEQRYGKFRGYNKGAK